jgi:hypothetical protein
MKSRRKLVAAKNRARQQHIHLLEARLSIYQQDPVRFAEAIASIQERLRSLQQDRQAFEDSEMGDFEAAR